MPRLNKATKLKLLIPLAYFVIANLCFSYLLTEKDLNRQILGFIITDIALVFWIIARIQLGNAFSIAPKSKFLVKSGLYSKLRHPVYYFSILAVIGISVFIWNPYAWVAVVAVILLEVFRIRKEESLLQQVFGKEYVSYKQQSWF